MTDLKNKFASVVLSMGLVCLSTLAVAKCGDVFELSNTPTRLVDVAKLNMPTTPNKPNMNMTIYELKPRNTLPKHIGALDLNMACDFDTKMTKSLQGFLSPEGIEGIKKKLGVIKDGGLTVGYLFRAWYSNPTQRYKHGALGDTIEAQTLNVEAPVFENSKSSTGARTKTQKVAQYTVSENEVFEDLNPRLFWPPITPGLEGLVRGMRTRPKIAAIISNLSKGASVAIFELKSSGRNGKAPLQPLHEDGDGKPGIYGFVETPKLVKIAQTPFIGMSHRWLNIIGVGDFDGDGTNEIAIVVTPHIGGRLEIWELRDGKLVKEAEMDGFTNHINGSVVQDMSAIGDYNADGVADLAVPDDSRKSIHLLSFLGGELKEIKTLPLPARITTNIVPLTISKNFKEMSGPPGLMMGLENNTLVVLRP